LLVHVTPGKRSTGFTDNLGCFCQGAAEVAQLHQDTPWDKPTYSFEQYQLHIPEMPFPKLMKFSRAKERKSDKESLSTERHHGDHCKTHRRSIFDCLRIPARHKPHRPVSKSASFHEMTEHSARPRHHHGNNNKPDIHKSESHMVDTAFGKPETETGGTNLPRRKSHSGLTRAEECHLERLRQIAQLDAWMEFTRRTCNDDEIPIIPNRLCCAQMIKHALVRREREYRRDVLHGRIQVRVSQHLPLTTSNSVPSALSISAKSESKTPLIPPQEPAHRRRESVQPASSPASSAVASLATSISSCSLGYRDSSEYIKSRIHESNKPVSRSISKVSFVVGSECGGHENHAASSEESCGEKETMHFTCSKEEESWREAYTPKTKAAWRCGPVIPIY